MNDAINKYLKKLEIFESEQIEDELKQLLNINNDSDFENLLLVYPNINEIIYKHYFSFLDEYKDNLDFIKMLVDENNLSNVCFLTLSDEILDKLYKYVIENGRESAENWIYIKNDQILNMLLTNNFSVEEILKFNMSENIRENISKLIVQEIKNGNYNIIKNIGSYRLSNNDIKMLINILNQLSNIGIDNPNDFFNTLIIFLKSKKLDNISFIENEEITKKLIKTFGSKAIIFASNPTKEIIELASDFSFDDYMMYDGTYKNSNELLLRFLKEGKDALNYCNAEAFDDEVVSYISYNNINFKTFYNDKLIKSLNYNKFLVNNNDYTHIGDLNCFSDLNTFNFVYNLVLVNSNLYQNSQIRFIKALINKSGFNEIYLWDIDSEVANRIVELGLPFDDYVNYYELHDDNITKAFIKVGYSTAIFMLQHSDEYMESATYENYLNFINSYPNALVEFKIVKKLLLEKHYDVLGHISYRYVYGTEDDCLKELHLDEISYDEYLNLPENVKNMNFFKKLFVDTDNLEELEKLLQNKFDQLILEKAVFNGLSFEKAKEYLGIHHKLTSNSIIFYLKKGIMESINYIKDSENENINEIVTLYLQLLKEELPNKKIMKNNNISKIICNYYFKKKDYRILQFNSYFDYERLLESGYGIDDFYKFPNTNVKLLLSIINSDNIEKVINCLKDNELRIFSGSEFIISLYRKGININELKKTQDIVYISLEHFISLLNEDEYLLLGIFQKELYKNKELLDCCINYLDPEMIKNDFNSHQYYYITNEVYLFIIKKMVERGYYDFINYYTYKGDIDTLKKAILCGYFPPDEVINNSPFLEKNILNLDFTNEEISYLKSKLDENPKTIIYFKDLLNNYDIVAKYILIEPEIYNYLPENIKNDEQLLLKILKVDSNFFCKIFYNLNIDLQYKILSTNKDLFSLLNLNLFSSGLIEKCISIYAQAIDYLNDYIIDDKNIKQALDNNYQINSNTNWQIISYALQNGYNVSKDIFNLDNLRTLVSLFNSNLSIIENFVLDTFNDLYKKYDIDFLFNLYLKNKERYNKKIYDYFLKFNIDINQFDKSCDTKEEFILNVKLISLKEKSEEEIKLLIPNLIEKFKNKSTVIIWLHNNGYNNLSETYAEKYFLEDPLKLISYIKITSDLVKKIKSVLINYPDLINYVDINEILDDKEFILKFLDYKSDWNINILDDKFKYDFDIARKYVMLSIPRICVIDAKTNGYLDICYEVLEKDGSYFKILNLLHNDEKALDIAIKKNPEVLIYADESLQTQDRINLIKNFLDFSFKDTSLNFLLKLTNNSNLINSSKDIIVDYLSALSYKIVELNEKINNKIIIDILNKNMNDLSIDALLNIINNTDDSILTDDLKNFRMNANKIIESSGKVNLLENNPCFTTDLILKIYPLIGIDETINLLIYNAGANLQIISLINQGKSELVLKYYQFIKKYNLFESNDKCIHFAFKNFNLFQDLIENILSQDYSLSEIDLDNLKNIMLNNNRYGIKTLYELKKYDVSIENNINSLLRSNDNFNIKNFLATLFGYNDLSNMQKEFINFGLDNFSNTQSIYHDIEKCYGKDILGKIKLDNHDIKIILLIKRIINTDNLEELKKYIQINKLNDYSNDVDSIIKKIRLLYNYQFNSKLSDVNKLEGIRTAKTKEITDYNGNIKNVSYELIDMNDGKFNFLAHRLYSYDSTHEGFMDKLIKDPSLWTKLDGASTLSTSSISELGFWLLHAGDNSGVIYLFNKLPDDFLLFMYGRDLFVEHGGHKLQPTSNYNLFTDIDSLNQTSCNFSNYSHYNEVAGFRQGMMPCAICCFDEPTDDQIRAADYFKIPIIKFNIQEYNMKKQERYTKALESFKIIPNYDNLYKIFYNGLKDTSLEEKINYCIDSIKTNYQLGNIDYKNMLSLYINMEKMINNIYRENVDAMKQVKKIQLMVSSIAMLKHVSEEEIIKLESANMGESGIMYTYEEKGKAFLVKPSVDKQNYDYQGFRAEIQASASKLQSIINPGGAVLVDVIGDNNLKLAKQEKINTSNEHANLLNNWASNGGNLDIKYSSQLLREYVIDFLLCNFDCYSGNFIIDDNDNIRGIDKEQSFRFIDNPESLNPNFSYIPNGNSRIPIYKLLFERYNKGEIDLNLDVVFDAISNIESMSDEDYKLLFKNYAYSLDKNHYEDILEKIVNRKNICIEKMKAYLNSINKNKGGNIRL